MAITKTNFINYSRCPRYVALDDLKQEKLDSMVTLEEYLKEEEEERINEILSGMYDEDNNELLGDVAKELGTEASGVPFIVVGEKYFSGFSSETSPEDLKEAIKEAYNNEDYQDVVAAVKKGASIKRKADKGMEQKKEEQTD